MGRTATVVRLRPSTTGLRCSECGAAAKAACNCGAPYIPAGQLAAKAIAANPQKSTRAIAEEIGVGTMTVSRARKSTVPFGTVEKRTGKDGKVRRLPVRPEPKISDPVKEINSFHKELIGFLSDFTERFNKWHDAAPVIDKDGKATLMQALYMCTDGFARLAQKLDGR
jgi:hypothetical protein